MKTLNVFFATYLRQDSTCRADTAYTWLSYRGQSGCCRCQQDTGTLSRVWYQRGTRTLAGRWKARPHPGHCHSPHPNPCSHLLWYENQVLTSLISCPISIRTINSNCIDACLSFLDTYGMRYIPVRCWPLAFFTDTRVLL